MEEDGLRALEGELGTSPPPGLARLNDGHLRSLAEIVKDARRRQAAELDAAGERALGHVPRLLRGPVRKILG